MKKRLFAMVMSLVLILSVCPVSSAVYAEPFLQVAAPETNIMPILQTYEDYYGHTSSFKLGFGDFGIEPYDFDEAQLSDYPTVWLGHDNSNDPLEWYIIGSEFDFPNSDNYSDCVVLLSKEFIADDNCVCEEFEGDYIAYSAYVDSDGQAVSYTSGDSTDGLRNLIVLWSTEGLLPANDAPLENALLVDAPENSSNEWRFLFAGNDDSTDYFEYDSESLDLDKYTVKVDVTKTVEDARLFMVNKYSHRIIDFGELSVGDDQEFSFMIPDVGFLWPYTSAIKLYYAKCDSTHASWEIIDGTERPLGGMTHSYAEFEYQQGVYMPNTEATIRIYASDRSKVAVKSLDENICTIVSVEDNDENSYYAYNVAKDVAVSIGQAGETDIVVTSEYGRSDVYHVIVADPSDTDYSKTGISSLDEFNDFIFQLYRGDSYLDKTIKLLSDIGSEDGEKVTVCASGFLGTLDGQGHSIWVDIAENGYVGLFQYNDGLIKNVTLRGSITSIGADFATPTVGTFVAQNNGTLYNCENYADVTVIFADRGSMDFSDNKVGGFTAQNDGLINGCRNYGRILFMFGSKTIMGAIAGYNNGVVMNCANYAEADGFNFAGFYFSMKGNSLVGFNYLGSVYNSINLYPGGVVVSYGGDRAGGVYNSFAENILLDAEFPYGISASYHLSEKNASSDEFRTPVSSEKACAKEGTGSLIELLNSYEDTETAEYPLDYMKWEFKDGDKYPTPAVGTEQNKVDVFYFDAEGVVHVARDAVILNSNTRATLGAPKHCEWYVVDGYATITELCYKTQYMGNAHIILKDGAKLYSELPIDTDWYLNEGLDIYAQSFGENAGEFEVVSENGSVAGAINMNINGGKVHFSGEYEWAYGLFSAKTFSVNNGELYAENKVPETPMFYTYTWRYAEPCVVSFANDLAVLDAQGGDAITCNDNWNDTLASEPAFWVGHVYEAHTLEFASVSSEVKIAAGKDYTLKTPDVLLDGAKTNDAVVSCLYYEYSADSADGKGEILDSKPSEIGEYVVEFFAVYEGEVARTSYKFVITDDLPEEESESSSDTVYVAPVKAKFVDVVKGEYYEAAVNWAVRKHFVYGTDLTHFDPGFDVTREQIIMMLWRIAGCPKSTISTLRFADVAEDNYYRDAILWGTENGIVLGTSETTFDPSLVCTRGQIAAFVARYAGIKDAAAETAFSDVPAEEYFAAAIKWATDEGIIYGITKTEFESYSNCTRAEAVTMLYRFLK